MSRNVAPPLSVHVPEPAPVKLKSPKLWPAPGETVFADAVALLTVSLAPAAIEKVRPVRFAVVKTMPVLVTTIWLVPNVSERVLVLLEEKMPTVSALLLVLKVSAVTVSVPVAVSDAPIDSVPAVSVTFDVDDSASVFEKVPGALLQMIGPLNCLPFEVIETATPALNVTVPV